MTSGQETFDLSDGALAVRVACEGGSILDARFDSRSFLVPGGGPEGTLVSFPLVPFGNRVANNGFTLAGTDYRFQPNSPDPLYLHGDGWLERWNVDAMETSKVILSLRHRPDERSPYDYSARQTIAVTNQSLILTLSVTHQGDTALLYGLGQHPFFVRTAKTRLTAGVASCWTERDGHLPGHAEPVPADLDFSESGQLPDRFVNNAFSGWDGQARIEWPELALAADIRATPPHDIVMLYLPSDRVDFFCFEPMTHMPNGHHLPGYGGLTLLQRGESMKGEVTIRIRRL
ncbi:MAG: aldose 1-epimerase [Rhizobium sp.]|nr:aldose 1-epimerase [Rhizobium sp.]